MSSLNESVVLSTKVGLIGCGIIAQLVHINVLRQLPNVELIALAETDPERRQDAHRRVPRAVVLADYQELLAMPEVEAVVICLPNALHAEVAVAALEHGKHVYLEKPLATNLKEAKDVLAAWRRAGLVGMIGFNLRFNAFYQAARKHIQSGRLGELVGVRSVMSAAMGSLPLWKKSRQSGGGVLLDLASHHIDMIHFLFGQGVREVFAELRSLRSEDDSVMLQLKLADGLLVQSFFSLCSVEEDRFEIYGQARKLTVDRYLSLNVEITDPTAEFARLKWLGRKLRSMFQSPYLLEKILAPSSEPSYRAAIAHFVAAARNNQPASPDFFDGYQNLAVIEAAEESARTKNIVSLSELTNENSAR